MGKLKFLVTIAAAAFLAACSGGSDGSLVNAGGAGGATAPANVAIVTLLTSSPEMPSDGTADATITALVRDDNNNVMEGVAVLFSSSSGSLVLSQPITTDANGVVTATLSTGGDPTNRTITVTGTASDGVTDTVTVDIVGTSLKITGPEELPTGDTSLYTVLLTTDEDGNDGIGGEQVTITSANNNGISQTPLTTDVDGQASFSLTASVGGIDTLTASALGLQKTLVVNVSTDIFAFTTPAADTQIPLGANQAVTVNWQDVTPVIGSQVTFTTTRGTMVPANGVVVTDGSGNATITVSASNGGPAVITATSATGTITQLDVQFIATVPGTLELQASPFTVPTNDQSTITAIVRDPNGNLVTNATVSFVLSDVTGGSLSVAQADTDIQGRAQTFYTASSTTSQVDGVQIDATVVSAPLVNDSVNLTVGQREVFITLGTGNTLREDSVEASYEQDWIIIVTDANGNGVDLVDLTVSILSERYWDGSRAYFDPPSAWLTRTGVEALPLAGCTDEDINNRNGILDPGEDLNGSTRIEAGNVSTVFALGGGGNTVTTGTDGSAYVTIKYPQEFALWVEVTLQALTAVQGTEFAESTTFRLPILAADVSAEGTAPPGIDSPFGTDGNCATPPPGLP